MKLINAEGLMIACGKLFQQKGETDYDTCGVYGCCPECTKHNDAVSLEGVKNE